MGVYVTQAQCLTFISGLVIDDAPKFENIITEAELDIDSLIAVPVPDPDSITNRRIDVTQLNAYRLDGLARAAAAQVEYRIALGPEFFVVAQPRTIKGPDFTTTGDRPRMGPKCRQHLGRVGLLYGMTRLSRNRNGLQ